MVSVCYREVDDDLHVSSSTVQCTCTVYMYASFNENDIMYAQICLPYKIFQFNLPDFVIFINYIFVCQTGSYVTLPSLNVGRVDHGCARYDNLQG